MPFRTSLLAAVCCVWTVSANAQNATNEQNALIDALEQGSILVCKAGQCVQTNHNMSREYLYNQLKALADANIGQNIDICEGNSATRQCVQKGISMPISSPTIQTYVNLPQAKLVDARAVTDVPGLDLIIDYKMKAGGTFPRCQAALSRIGTRHAGSSEMMSPRFNCGLTETGNTTFSLAYHIDYIDFDQGIIGAQYTIAADNILTGANAGYVLMDFDKGVKMDADETFPYPEQLAALQSGEVATFDTPGEIEAVWMKPTPFLNLLTPTFSPNNCYTFDGGCSAQMLNNPTTAVPPAQARLDALTPPNVASTTGLIQQTVSVDPASPAERKTVTTKTIIAENGKAVYSEEATRHYVRETMDGPLTEDTTKAQVRTVGEKPLPIEQAVQNAEKEYAAMKQFEAQTQGTVQNGTPVVQGMQRVSKQIPSSQIVANAVVQPTTVSAQGQVTQPVNVASAPQQVMGQPVAGQPNAKRQLGQPITQTNVEIIVPEGVALSEAERAYIEQIALASETQNGQQQNIAANVVPAPNGAGYPVQSGQGQQNGVVPVSMGYPNDGVPYNRFPIVSTNGKTMQPVVSSQPRVVPAATEKPVTITADTTPVKEEQTSFWGDVRKNLNKWLYF